MTCESCQAYDKNKLSGVYDFTCLDCCVRLVMSTYPKKAQASAMLAAITMKRTKTNCVFSEQREAPSREAIMQKVAEKIKEILV